MKLLPFAVLFRPQASMNTCDLIGF